MGFPLPFYILLTGNTAHSTNHCLTYEQSPAVEEYNGSMLREVSVKKHGMNLKSIRVQKLHVLGAAFQGPCEMCFILVWRGRFSGRVSYGELREDMWSTCSYRYHPPYVQIRLGRSVHTHRYFTALPRSAAVFADLVFSVCNLYLHVLFLPLRKGLNLPLPIIPLICATNGETAIAFELFAVSCMSALNYLCARLRAHLSHQWSFPPFL